MKQELPNFHNKIIRSFGRIKSRKLSPSKQFLLANSFNKIKLDLNYLKHLNSNNESTINILEIGFGFGDFLYNIAKNNPDKNFYGFEPHINGIVNLLNLIEGEKLNNIKISNSDIRFEIKNFTNNFFDEIYILFPDPWPKYKHHKRRLITNSFLDDFLAFKLKNHGKIIIVTDHDSYKTWILANILNSKKFIWNANHKKDWQNFPSYWHETKYQKKAVNEGRIPMIIELIPN